MIFRYTLLRIEYLKITAVGAFVFRFLFNNVFSFPLLESKLLLIGWLGHFRLDHDRFLWCLLKKNIKTVWWRKIFIRACFFHFWQFLQGLKLVLVVSIGLTNVVFSSIANWFWLSKFVFMIINIHFGDSNFGFNFTCQKVNLIRFGILLVFSHHHNMLMSRNI